MPIASAQRTLAALARPETWPDYGSDLGRFTAVRSGGLAGQTFEIEIISALSPRTPAILRGYVTVTRFFTREDDPHDLEHYAARLSELMVRYGRDEPPAYPPGCTPLAVICVDTHDGPLHGPRRATGCSPTSSTARPTCAPREPGTTCR